MIDRWRHRNVTRELGPCYDTASALVKVAADFRKRFSPELEGACRAALHAEIFSEPSTSITDRMEIFRERCDFVNGISNKAFDTLDAALSEHMKTDCLPMEVFNAIIHTAALVFCGEDSELASTYFGARVLVSGAQETISIMRQMFFDLLILVTFVDGEWEQISKSDFNAADLFSTMIDLLREYEMMAWLSSNVRKCPDSVPKVRNDLSTPSRSLKDRNTTNKNQRTATILEDLFVTDIKPQQAIDSPQSYTLTLGIRDVVAWITREGEVNYQNAVAHIQCDLIAKNNIDLAWDFSRFQASTSWSTYVKGRLHVAMSEFDSAAIYFRKAAYLLCMYFIIAISSRSTDSSQLLESQWAIFPTCQQSSWTSSMSIASTMVLPSTTSTSFPYSKRCARIRMSRTLPAWRCRPSTRKWGPSTTLNTRPCATISCLDCSPEPSRLASLTKHTPPWPDCRTSNSKNQS
jgi:nuclear pore complex protein Nup160